MKTAKWIFYVLAVSGALLAAGAVAFFSEASTATSAFSNTMWPVLPVELQVIFTFIVVVLPSILAIEAFT